MKKVALLISIILITNLSFGQKVGVVLSGGGAIGFAHIGVLKALEENDIPIDYITGTSAGALIGGLYVSGYSPQEIEDLVLSESFEVISSGTIEDEFKYYIEEPDEDASLFSLRLSKDSIFQKALATNVLNPTFLDLKMMGILGTNSPQSHNNYDSLFVPYRCVASDIVTKTSIMFKSGNLNMSVRASMTYPFFINPIEIDGVLMFDGGLYNNFPAENMYNEFDPDYIIGSNVSYNEPAPVEDDLMSQVRNMFSSHSNYSLPCESGLIITPELTQMGTFEFDKIKEAIDEGYNATMAKMDSIKESVDMRITKEERAKARESYKAKGQDIGISEINATKVKKDQARYIESKLIRTKKNEILTYDVLKKRYLKLYQSEHIRSLFPTLTYLTDSTQRLNLVVKKEKPLRVAFGGHYSSRPVNTGFLSISYSDFQLTPYTAYANAYFGKFYGSVKVGLKFFLPTRSISYIEPMFVMNRWDYFRSLATFFEDVQPSFIIQNEMFTGMSYNLATSKKSKFSANFAFGRNTDEYYQIDDFTNKDTTDVTEFLFYSPGLEFSINSLNRKQWASGGYKFQAEARFIHGIEEATPGSTAINDIPSKTFRNWAFLKVHYTNYFMKKGVYRLGIMAEGVYSIQPYFQNYKSSILSAHAFRPTPDSHLAFFDDFRSNKYLGGGLMNVFSIKDYVDIRLEAYIFQPIVRILESNGQAVDSEYFASRFGLASVSVIYHSPIGPLRATVNYTDSETIIRPLTFQLSFGYVLFNRHGIK
ncbi:MAG: NTE family protein [Arenicella sp.]